MNALDTLLNITTHESLFSNHDLRYCLVDSSKHPIRPNGEIAHPNKVDDFVKIEDLLQCTDLTKYAGVGISIQASNICAIDVDHCFSKSFDIHSADGRAKQIIAIFRDTAYIEFSFSGLGMRVLFKHPIIADYAIKYYIKNDKQGIEYYQPNSSYRYVTLTGQTICDNDIANVDSKVLMTFLEMYMLRPIIMRTTCDVSDDSRSIEELLQIVKRLYFKDMTFQDLWFMTEQEHITKLFCNIQGKSKESHADFQLLSLLYENVTQDKEKLRLVFESSPYFKSKDYKHSQKWTKYDYRYYNYQFNNIQALHGKK